MTNETIYLLETLVVTVPAAGCILYIVNNLRTKLKAALEKISKQEAYISSLHDYNVKTEQRYKDERAKALKTNLAYRELEIKLNEFELAERKAAAQASTPKLKDINVDFGSTADGLPTLILSYDDSTACVPLVTEEKVKAIVSEAMAKTFQMAVADALNKTRRRGL